MARRTTATGCPTRRRPSSRRREPGPTSSTACQRQRGGVRGRAGPRRPGGRRARRPGRGPAGGPGLAGHPVPLRRRLARPWQAPTPASSARAGTDGRHRWTSPTRRARWSPPAAGNGSCCPDGDPDLLVLRPLGGTDDDIAGGLPGAGAGRPTATFPPPSRRGSRRRPGRRAAPDRAADRLHGPAPARSGRWPRSRSNPAPYQLVPLLMALRQPVVRLLICDDVGIGKTIEAGLIATELLAQGEAQRPGRAVLPGAGRAVAGRAARASSASTPSWCCAPPSPRLERGLALGESLFDRYPVPGGLHRLHQVRPGTATTSSHHCPDLVIVDEAHTCVSADGTGARSAPAALRAAAPARRRPRAAPDAGHRHPAFSGNDERSADLIGLLDPALAHARPGHRGRQAAAGAGFVQRRRADIRSYLERGHRLPR